LQKTFTIKKFPKYSESTDYDALVRDYIDECQKYSSHIWTDYNIHDPGITALELLCLAITELGLKSELDIFRIIFNSQKLNFNPEEYALYSALDVFPTLPVTISDYRKSILDKFINYVDNVWVEPVPFAEDGARYKGLINILVKPKSDIDKKNLVQNISKYYLSIKNMGEDLSSVIVMDAVNISINLSARVKGNMLPEEIQAELRQILYLEIERPVEFESYLSDIQKGGRIEDILSGPLLDNGRIKDASIEDSGIENITNLYKSKLLYTIASSKYIDKIESIEILVDGKPIESDHIKIGNKYFPSFDYNGSKFSLYKENNLLRINKETQEYIYRSTYKTRKIFSKKSLEDYLTPDLSSNIALGDINYLYSIQNQFPKIYGISSYGLVSKSAKFKTSSLQLKAYLSFFEQIMQNYLAQLSNVDKLFSLIRTDESTYFTKYPENIPEFDKVSKEGIMEFGNSIQAISDNFDNKYKRRNEFINHLCARFGEEFPQNIYSGDIIEQSNDPLIRHLKEIRLKSKYLQNYATLSMQRTKSSISDNNLSSTLSAFHIKMLILLGIENLEERDTTMFTLGINTKTKHTLKFEVKDNDELKLLFSNIINENNYGIENEKGKYCLYFYWGEVKKIKITDSNRYSECEKVMEEIKENGMKINQYSEYFHLIENILLRPDKEGLSSMDPFSNICTIILPDWPYRFQQSSFHNNFKNLVQAHTPIHIKFKIHFLNFGEMQKFEKLNRELKTSENKTSTESSKKKLIDFLNSLQTI